MVNALAGRPVRLSTTFDKPLLAKDPPLPLRVRTSDSELSATVYCRGER